MGHRITKHTHKNKTHTKEVLFFTVVPYWKVSVRPYYSIIWRGLLQICDTHQLEKVSNTALFYHDDLMSPSVHDMYMYSNINARHKKFKTKQNKKKNLRVCLFTFVFSSTRSLQTIYFSRNVCTCMCVRRCFIAFAQSALWLHYDCILFSCDFCTPMVWLSTSISIGYLFTHVLQAFFTQRPRPRQRGHTALRKIKGNGQNLFRNTRVYFSVSIIFFIFLWLFFYADKRNTSSGSSDDSWRSVSFQTPFWQNAHISCIQHWKHIFSYFKPVSN